MLTYVGKNKFRNQKNTFKITIILNASPTALLMYHLKTKYVAPTSFAHHFFVENMIIFISPNYTWPYNPWRYHEREMGVSQINIIELPGHYWSFYNESSSKELVFFPLHMFCLITCNKFIIKLNETTNCKKKLQLVS